MELILWRHADAEDAGPAGDLARNLTRKGRAQAERMAAWLRPRLEGRWLLVSSPAARATQTAAALGLECEVRPRLGPSHGAAELLREAGRPAADRVIVVGHNPTLGEAAAQLLGAGASEVAFRKGAIWWFATRQRGGRDEAVLRTVLAPDALEP